MANAETNQLHALGVLLEAHDLATDDQVAGAPICAGLRLAFARDSLITQGYPATTVEDLSFAASFEYDRMQNELGAL